MSKENVSEKYKQLSLHDHILTLPDTYIGSTKAATSDMWVLEGKKMVKKEITYVPGLYKIYDEILVNARDHYMRDKTCKSIKVNIDKETGEISVWNDGSGIEVEIHEKTKLYVPELIFSHLLTSSNYEKKGKLWGGKNGYGAKLTNIYSKHFTVKTVDSKNHKKYEQHFYDNMKKKDEAIIKSVSKDTESYTKISFIPDYERFGLKKGITDDIVALFKKRVYDIVACANRPISVYLNDEQIKIETFGDYVKMFYDTDDVQLVYNRINDRWKIGVVYNHEDGFTHMSFVNGIWTFSQSGGTHVNHVVEQVVKGLSKYIKDNYKDVNVKNSQLKESLSVYIDCMIEDPEFGSQTKETLTTKASDFAVKCDVPESFIQSLAKTGIVDDAVAFAKAKEQLELKKTDGKKTKRIMNKPKLEDALWAGTAKSKECRLIITEGDSAKTFAVQGLKVIGRERFGVFPIRGKMLNVREATLKQQLNNEEIKNLKEIIGLKNGEVYTEENIKTLRYGGILILADQDVDGSHIKGLVMNFIQYYWPSLAKITGFTQSMYTPIIKAFKKSDHKLENPVIFYTLTDYDNWKTELGNKLSSWDVKYYKGLGTSKPEEACDAFNDFEKRVLSYIWETSEEKDEEASEGKSEDIISPSYDGFMLAFSKNRSDDRKEWLKNYDKTDILDSKEQLIPFSQFFNKDMKHYSNYDNIRSIPSMCDGLKPSQRKILFTALEKKIYTAKKEIKVARFAASVSERTEYLHGERSLEEAMVGMAQNFVGSNNINVLYPDGNFGTRKNNSSSASPRYIFTYLTNITKYIYRDEDMPIYNYRQEEGHQIEPEAFAPVVPMILINGTEGIGTGFSTSVPQYNPIDIVKNIKRYLKDEEMEFMRPWFRGFKGTIEDISEEKFLMTGSYEVIDQYTVHITDLPVGVWSEDYREFLESIKISKKNESPKQFIDDYEDLSDNYSIDITVSFSGNTLQQLVKNDKLAKSLKLVANVNTTNMHLHDVDDKIKRYALPTDILEEFCQYRLFMYKKRKEYYVKILQNELNILKYKAKFIEKKLNKEIIIENKKKEDILQKLEELKFPKLSTDINATDAEKSYKYITNMQLFDLTQERIEELKTQYENKKAELEKYENTEVKDMWIQELDEFLIEYKSFLKETDEYYTYKPKTKTGEKKTKTVRRAKK